MEVLLDTGKRKEYAVKEGGQFLKTAGKEEQKTMLYSKQDLKRLMIPLVIEQLLAILVGLADTIMIASAGENAVSGVSLVDNINILIINVFTALATGGAVVAGHYLGQKNEEGACRAAWQLILFSLFSSLAVTALFLVSHEWILHTVFGNITQEVMESARTYLIITAYSIVPLALYNACAALFRAMGNSRVTMWISLLMNLINFIGNAILIYGAGWGVAGAAAATTCSRLVAAVLILFLIWNPKRTIHIAGVVSPKINLPLVKKILYIGIPSSLENSMFQLGKIILLSLISGFGTYAIAANAVANTVAAINVLPGMAINMAILSVVSVCVGAGELEQARYYTRKMMQIIYGATGVLSILLFIGTPVIVKIYNLSPETSVLATQVIRYHACMAFLIWPVAFSLPNTFRAAGDVVYTMVTAILSMWLFRIAAAYLLGGWLGAGLLGVWIAMTIDWGFRAVLYVPHYLRGSWKKKLPPAGGGGQQAAA